MCGICGFVDIERRENAERALTAMTRTLAHRGPDATCTWMASDGMAGLGHTRLAIIDLEGGGQPMQSADARYTIAFNGEIYNHPELRRELEDTYPFSTRSDTEVLLAAYSRWGATCLDRLRGMFAFAIWDVQSRELFMARDRTGVKPLFYHAGPAGFRFGSEIKALLADPMVPRKVYYPALADYFMLGFALPPATFFDGILEVEPGSWLRVSQGGVTAGRYWRWQRQPEDWDEFESLERSEQAILASLEEHLISDVPIGAFLSGGIDSSLLVALLRHRLNRDIETFNVRFCDAAFDESPYARMVAEYIGCRHHEIGLNGGTSDLSLVERVMRQFDQPFGDSSSIPTYLICQEMRRHVKVAISGDGGDEMFGGYPDFHYTDVAWRLGRLPSPALKALRRGGRALAGVAPDRARQVEKLLRAAEPRNGARILALSSYVYMDELSDVLSVETHRRLGAYTPALRMNGRTTKHGPDGLDNIDATIEHTLPGDFLRKVDIASSAHGLEVRVPLLGEHVLECSQRLPDRLRYSSRQSKIILRRLAERYLPHAVAVKPKAGFSIPLDTWLGKSGREEIRAVLESPGARLRDLVRSEHVARLVSGFVHQTYDRSRFSRYNVYQQVYFLWSLELWLEQWNPSL